MIHLFDNPAEDLLFMVFGVIITAFLFLDLFVFHKKAAKVTTGKALIETTIWITISLVFGGLIYFYVDADKSFEFASAYLTEYALSMDNIFVILLILRYFRINEAHYHGVLFWGVFGAIVFRAIFIFLGAALIHEFHWILYFFGAFLLYTGGKMLISKEDDDHDFDPSNNWFLKTIKKYFHFTSVNHGDKFFVIENGRRVFTTLFMALMLIESTDLIFAVDSIPAVFGISDDEFVVYTSNMFAVMGLRSMFFLLSGVIDKFYLLPKGLALVLVFIGGKMLADYWHIHLAEWMSLLIIVALLGGSVLLSILIPKKEEAEAN